MFQSFGEIGPHIWDGLAARVIGTFYRDPTAASWPEALEELAQVHEASWAHIQIDDHDIAAPRLLALNVSADAGILRRLVAGGFASLDPRPALLTQNDGRVTGCWQLLDPDTFDQTMFVKEFLDRPENDLRWSMAGGKTLSSGSRLLFGVARARREGAFGLDDIGALDALGAHIIGAVELHETLRALQREALLVSQIGERNATALLAVDRRGRLAHYNVRAGTLLARGQEVKSQHGHLKFAHPRVQAALDMALTQAADSPAIRVNEGALQFKVYAVPEMASPVAGALPPLRVVVEIRETLGAQAIHLLSARERQVAELLAEGLTAPDIAERLGKSLETVRTQLKSAMRKAKVNRQSQLVRAMLEGRPD